MASRPNQASSSCAGYHPFIAEDGDYYGSFEVFWVDGAKVSVAHSHAPSVLLTEPGEPILTPGWYWWSAFPGCLPDGEACGPFKTSREAMQDARNL